MPGWRAGAAGGCRIPRSSKATVREGFCSNCSAPGVSRKPRSRDNVAEWHRSNAIENVARSSGFHLAAAERSTATTEEQC